MDIYWSEVIYFVFWVYRTYGEICYELAGLNCRSIQRLAWNCFPLIFTLRPLAYTWNNHLWSLSNLYANCLSLPDLLSNAYYAKYYIHTLVAFTINLSLDILKLYQPVSKNFLLRLGYNLVGCQNRSIIHVLIVIIIFRWSPMGSNLDDIEDIFCK